MELWAVILPTVNLGSIIYAFFWSTIYHSVSICTSNPSGKILEAVHVFVVK